MAKIKIKDIPEDIKISREEMKVIRGGISPNPEPPNVARPFINLREKLYLNLYGPNVHIMGLYGV